MKNVKYLTTTCSLVLHSIICLAVVLPMSSTSVCDTADYLLIALVLEFPGSILALGLSLLTQSGTVFVYSTIIFGAISYSALGWFIGILIQRQQKKRTANQNLEHISDSANAV